MKRSELQELQESLAKCGKEEPASFAVGYKALEIEPEGTGYDVIPMSKSTLKASLVRFAIEGYINPAILEQYFEKIDTIQDGERAEISSYNVLKVQRVSDSVAMKRYHVSVDDDPELISRVWWAYTARNAASRYLEIYGETLKLNDLTIRVRELDSNDKALNVVSVVRFLVKTRRMPCYILQEVE